MSDQSSEGNSDRETSDRENYYITISASGSTSSASAGSIAGDQLYVDPYMGIVAVPPRIQSYDPHSNIRVDYNQDELQGRGSRSMGRYANPPRIRELLYSNKNNVINDDELFMEFTMKRNKNLIKKIEGSINFMILGQNEALMHCRMKMQMPFRKLMRLYAESLGLSRHVLVYTYQGQLVEMTDSPMSIGLLKGDTIVVAQRRIKSITIATEVLD